jgi:hypothetical protein
MSLTTVLAILNLLGCQEREGWQTTRCPMPEHGRGRGDRNPSLGVKLDLTKGLILHCPAGCHPAAIAKHLGHEWRDLYMVHKQPPRPNLAEVEARYRRGELKLASPPVFGFPEANPSSDDTRDGRNKGYDTRDGWVSPLPSVMSSLVSLGRDELGPTARSVLNDVLLVLGLYAAAGDIRPVPYSVRFCCRRMGWDIGRASITRASRTLSALEKTGYLVVAEELAPRGKIRGTKCYLPTAKALRQGVQPRDEANDQVAGWLPRKTDAEDGAQAINLYVPPNGADGNHTSPEADAERRAVKGAIAESLGLGQEQSP